MKYGKIVLIGSYVLEIFLHGKKLITCMKIPVQENGYWLLSLLTIGIAPQNFISLVYKENIPGAEF